METNEPMAKVIAQGKWRFILVIGVLFWGLSSATLVSILTYFFKTDASASDFVRPFVIFPPMGILWGAAMWSWNKRRFAISQRGKV